jgi:nucleotide-binding universal stress UspA family protein
MTLSLLVPLDGSATAEAALDVACRLATEAHARICLLQVVPHAHATGTLVPGWEPIGAQNVGYRREPQVQELETVTQAATRLETEAQDYLSRVASRLQGLPVSRRVRSGSDPAEEIVRGALAGGADLIVMTTHGRTGRFHRHIGSVAEGVLQQSDIPVLLVRSRQEGD